MTENKSAFQQVVQTRDLCNTARELIARIHELCEYSTYMRGHAEIDAETRRQIDNSNQANEIYTRWHGLDVERYSALFELEDRKERERLELADEI